MENQSQLPEHTSEAVTTYQPMDIVSPDETAYLANDLAKFIRENKLCQNIQGKEYVNVEGWQYAGSRLGILPVIEKLGRYKNHEENEIKYGCKVNLFDLRRQCIVGVGFAICSNKEASKKYYQEFAIASMAQTRAIGKAYRNILAWIVRAAGYEPTPLEEMDYQNSPTTQSKPVEKLNNDKTRTELAKTEYVEPPAKTETHPVTINQKTQILLLLNNSVITTEEKQKMVAKLNTFDTVRGDQAIAKLKATIKERCGDPLAKPTAA